VRETALCHADVHVWRRHDRERHQPLSRYAVCDCDGRRFGEVAPGEFYEVVFFNANGLLLPGDGPHRRGVGKD